MKVEIFSMTCRAIARQCLEIDSHMSYLLNMHEMHLDSCRQRDRWWTLIDFQLYFRGQQFQDALHFDYSMEYIVKHEILVTRTFSEFGTETNSLFMDRDKSPEGKAMLAMNENCQSVANISNTQIFIALQYYKIISPKRKALNYEFVNTGDSFLMLYIGAISHP